MEYYEKSKMPTYPFVDENIYLYTYNKTISTVECIFFGTLIES